MKIKDPTTRNINLKMDGIRPCFIVAKTPQNLMKYFEDQSPDRIGEVLEMSRLDLKNKSKEFGEMTTPFGKKKIEHLYWVETEKSEIL